MVLLHSVLLLCVCYHVSGQDTNSDIPVNVLSEVREAIKVVREEFFTNLAELPINSSCVDDVVRLLEANDTINFIGIHLHVKGIEAALDSWGKLEPAILQQNMHFQGAFDECLAMDVGIAMQYCQMALVPVILHGNTSTIVPLPFYEDICIPASCTYENDIQPVLKLINKTLHFLGRNFTFYMEKSYGPLNLFFCTPQGSTPYSAGAIVMIIISSIFGLLVIIGTVYDQITEYISEMNKDSLANSLTNSTPPINKKKNATEMDTLLGTPKSRSIKSRLSTLGHESLIGFSLYKTLPAILSTHQPSSAITSLNGMRVISMFWVILGHSYFFLWMFGQFKNLLYVHYDIVPRFSIQPVVNGFFSVDSFFFLSGFLVAYLSLRDMKRRNGRFPYLMYYIHRVLRITPTYMFVLFFYWFLTVHLSHGPTSSLDNGPGSGADQSCRDYWWTNLLYINNFYPTTFEGECMGWTWYLANDMQFFVISPIFIVLLYTWFPAGILTLAITLLASFGVTGFIAGYYGYHANVFYEGYFNLIPPTPSVSTEIYGKPYCRIGPYLVGILLGYIIYKGYSIKVSKFLNIILYGLLWILAAILGLATVYGFYGDYHGYPVSTAGNIAYFMFARTAWGVALALVLYACHYGYGGPINKFLSMPFWVPLSRLTFNAYLFHEIVLEIIFTDQRTGIYYTDISMAIYCIATVAFSYGAAGIVCVLVEFPLSNVEMAIFKFFGLTRHESARHMKKDHNKLIADNGAINN